jgi:hypothetical protein
MQIRMMSVGSSLAHRSDCAKKTPEKVSHQTSIGRIDEPKNHFACCFFFSTDFGLRQRSTRVQTSRLGRSLNHAAVYRFSRCSRRCNAQCARSNDVDRKGRCSTNGAALPLSRFPHVDDTFRKGVGVDHRSSAPATGHLRRPSWKLGLFSASFLADARSSLA